MDSQEPITSALPVAVKQCRKCKLIKELTEFKKDNRKRGGYGAQCKSCTNEYEKARSKRKTIESPGCHYSREYYLKHKQRLIDINRKSWQKNRLKNRLKKYQKQHGIEPSECLDLYNSQGQACAICGKKTELVELVLDYCHITGKVRGFLCGEHNSLLGFSHDSPEVLFAAYLYLKKYEL